MSGVTKHIFNQEVRDILSMWDCEIKTIEPLLPKEYSSGDIITLLKEFYPHEWHSVESTGGAFNGRLSVQENSVKGISAHTF